MNNKKLEYLEKINIYENDAELLKVIENSKKEMNILGKKRNFSFKDFDEINESDKINKMHPINERELFERLKKLKDKNFFSQNNNIFEEIKNSLNLNENENEEKVENNLNEINNIKDSNKNNIKSEDLDKKKEKEENSKENENNEEYNYLNPINKNDKNNNVKKNLFNVTIVDGQNDEDFFIRNLNLNSNSNEVKVLKNNKLVYANSSLLNSYYYYRKSKTLEKKSSSDGQKKRSSKYRGVSKNGNQWQVLIMLDRNKSYIRSYSSEYVAARVYDILAIKSKGFKARTNFIYDYEKIKKIIEMNIDIKAKNINEIITNLFD